MGYCTWADINEANRIYHDTEWGIPVHDDRHMFEHLSLECLQCGLSWDLMLKKREIFRQCFDNFDYDKIAAYDDADVERILNTEGMIRSRRKVEAVIYNAIRIIFINAVDVTESPIRQDSRLVWSHFVRAGEIAVLVCPIDESAPKGRLILPQQQVIRELLDMGALALVCQPAELAARFEAPPKFRPNLVITDSQAFGAVAAAIPRFSVAVTLASSIRTYRPVRPEVGASKA